MQHCHIAVVFLAAVACALAQVPIFCPAIYAPICGSDGHTYPSECFWRAAKVQQPDLLVAYTGECIEPDRKKRDVEDFEKNPYGCVMAMTVGFCPMLFQPICSSDGTTSANHCTFCRHYFAQKGNGIEITRKHGGQCTLDEFCPEMSKKGFCPEIYAPVCSNGKTYDNNCMRCAELYKLQAAGQKVYYSPGMPGTCPGHHVQSRAAEFCIPRFYTGVCTFEYNPVCGSDGMTYGNPCHFCYTQHLREKNGQELGFESFGQCENVPMEDEEVIDCSQYDARPNVCTLEYSPVCGSDGKTYGNRCFYCGAKRQKLGLQVDHFGQCWV